MTNLQKMQQWLQTYPAWDGMTVGVEFTHATPVGLGLYSRGREKLACKEDILGRKEFRCQFKFLLQLQQFYPNADDEIAAFQAWVEQQSAQALTPRFGDDPARETMNAKLVQLQKHPNSGSQLQAVELTAEFIKIY